MQQEEESYLRTSQRLSSLMNAVTDKVRLRPGSPQSPPKPTPNPVSPPLQSVFGDGENTKMRVAELEDEVHTLKKINKDLYEFSSQLLTKPT